MNASSETPSALHAALVYCVSAPLVALTVLGNGAILATLLCQARLLSSPCNYFVASLALADLLVGLLVMPHMVLFSASARGLWLHGQTACHVWMAFDFLCSSASFLTLSVMSVERYRVLTTSYVHVHTHTNLFFRA